MRDSTVDRQEAYDCGDVGLYSSRDHNLNIWRCNGVPSGRRICPLGTVGTEDARTARQLWAKFTGDQAHRYVVTGVRLSLQVWGYGRAVDNDRKQGGATKSLAESCGDHGCKSSLLQIEPTMQIGDWKSVLMW